METLLFATEKKKCQSYIVRLSRFSSILLFIRNILVVVVLVVVVLL